MISSPQKSKRIKKCYDFLENILSSLHQGKQMPGSIQQNYFLPAAANMIDNIPGTFNRCHSIGISMND